MHDWFVTVGICLVTTLVKGYMLLVGRLVQLLVQPN
jgi:hypothetical protein